VIHEVQLGVVDFEDEGIWLCAACGTCAAVCPSGEISTDYFKTEQIVTQIEALL
jgi:heterodisulfide reductase subunit A-like polyferredoxin